MPQEQLSRVAGVPRLPLPIFKAAAEQYFIGKEASRSEQQNGKKSKVKLLRELSANDPAVRSWLLKFARDYKAEETRRIAADQGLTINAASANRPLSLVDRMVAVLEAGQKPDDHFSTDELNSPADPEWEAVRAEIDARLSRKAEMGCNTCGLPATHQIGGHWFCDRHDGKPTGIQPPPVPDGSPAAYINSSFGKDPAPTPAPMTPSEYHNAQDRMNQPVRAMVGPVPKDAVFLGVSGVDYSERPPAEPDRKPRF